MSISMLEALQITTIMFLLGALVMFVAIFNFKEKKSLIIFFLYFLFSVIGLLGFVYRANLSYFLSFYVANIFLISAQFLLVWATLSYQQKVMHKMVGFILFALYLIGYYFFNYIVESFEIRLLMYETYTILLLFYILIATYEKDVEIKVHSRFFDILVILSLIQHVIRLFRFFVADVGDDLLANNFDAFNTLLLGIIALLRTNGIFGLYNNKYQQHLIKSNQEIEKRSLDLIERLSVAAEYKDNDTGDHVKRMSTYSKFLALKLGYSNEDATLLEQAAPMHDVGKIGISELIINKPGKLDKDEWGEMMKHCTIGSEILGSHTDKLLSLASVVALQHHEKWNGSGYPNKLKENNIDYNARIVSVADVYDALTSERPYKKAWPKEKVIKLFEEEKGKSFDPNVVDALLHHFDELDALRLSFIKNV